MISLNTKRTGRRRKKVKRNIGSVEFRRQTAQLVIMHLDGQISRGEFENRLQLLEMEHLPLFSRTQRL